MTSDPINFGLPKFPQTSVVALRTFDKFEFSLDEVKMVPDELYKLPWVESGVGRLHRKRFGYEVHLGPYVGTLLMGAIELRVREIVPGTVAACIELSATGRRFGMQASQGLRKLPALEAIAVEYSAALNEVLQHGISKAYSSRQHRTSHPKGKLLVSESINRCWARGRTDSVIALTRPLTEDTQINRVLLAGALRADALLDLKEGQKTIREQILVLSGATSLVRPEIPDAHAIPDAPTRRAVSIAKSLIEGVPLPSSLNVFAKSRHSTWINVERIFEEAIFSILHRFYPKQAFTGKSLGVQIFGNFPGDFRQIRKRADPDIVLKFRDKVLILDAKYRRSGEDPSDAELYQLIAHAGAFGAVSAAIVAPALHGHTGVRRLGKLRDGCSIDIIAVDPADSASVESILLSWVHEMSTEPGVPLASNR